MPVYTIELTDVEQKSMEYVAVSVNDWIQNAVHERARLAGDELAQDDMKAKIEAGEPISGTRDEIIMASELPNAQERSDAATEAAMAAMRQITGDAIR